MSGIPSTGMNWNAYCHQMATRNQFSAQAQAQAQAYGSAEQCRLGLDAEVAVFNALRMARAVTTEPKPKQLPPPVPVVRRRLPLLPRLWRRRSNHV